MKAKLTIRNIIVAVGALLAIVGFFLGFAATLVGKGEKSGIEVAFTYKNIIFGCNALDYYGKAGVITVSGSESLEGIGAAVLPLIGLIVAAVGAVLAIVVALVGNKKSWAKLALVICGLAVVAGGVLVFFTKDAFCGAYAASKGGSKSDAVELFKDWKLNFGAIIAGILPCVGGAAIVVSQLIPLKK